MRPELPLWIQASYAMFYGGMFIVGCVIALWVLDHIPALYNFFDRVLGGPDEDV